MDSAALIAVGASALIVGFVLGAGVMLLVRGSIARAMFSEADERRKLEERALLATVQQQFGVMSNEALQHSSAMLMQLAEGRLRAQGDLQAGELDKKKALIDQQLGAIQQQMQGVASLVNDLEAKRAERMGELSNELHQLTHTSRLLTEMLRDNRRRGQWGERTAADLLERMGFREGINYIRQSAREGLDGRTSRPDFTFGLPNGKQLHMDVKFPFNRYEAYLGTASGDPARVAHLRGFLGDARSRVRELSGRDYINEDTVNCVLIFIPNEHIFGFLLQHDPDLVDYAVEQRVVICSPSTLFAALSIIRQAAENYTLEQNTRKILTLMAQFEMYWKKYTDKMDAVGKSLRSAQTAYDDMVGARSRTLQKPIDQIRLLRERVQADDDDPDVIEQNRLFDPDE